MPASVTVTGKAGPGISVTSKTFNNLGGVLILIDRGILQLFTGGDTNSPAETEIDITASTAISGTISGAGKSLTLTIS